MFVCERCDGEVRVSAGLFTTKTLCPRCRCWVEVPGVWGKLPPGYEVHLVWGITLLLCVGFTCWCGFDQGRTKGYLQADADLFATQPPGFLGR